MTSPGSLIRCRVVTWNVHSCIGSDGAYDPSRVADVLGPLQADIIGLQEMDWRHAGPDDLDPLESIAARLGMTSVAGPNLRDHRGEYGNGLLTRFDVEHVDRVHLAHEGREPRGAIDARLRAGNIRVRAMVTHLGLKRGERRRQLQWLRHAVAERPTADAIVLLADLNEWVPGAGKSLTPEPFPVRTAGRTYPSRFPSFKLDQILVRPEPVSFEYRVVRSRAARLASDHLPVVADVVWPAA